MLQKIRVHTQGWMAWVVVVILAFVFALWGISSELITGSGDKVVAQVAGNDITTSELQKIVERMAQQSQMAQVMAGIQTPIINEELIRKQALESLVLEQVLSHEATSEGFLVTADQVNEILVKLPQFQENGQFSPQVFERIIRQMNFTPESFQETILNEMLITQAQSTLRDSAFVVPYQLQEAVDLVNQTRDIQYAVFDADTFASQVTLTPEDLQAYYNGHQSEFMTDESVVVAYVEVDKKAMAEKIKTQQPSETELLAGYESRIASYTSPERRSAKHILVAVKPDATPEVRNTAKLKAQSILEQLKQGAVFADVAKKSSDDPGSANTGGDLGTFGRGEMVPPFEDAVFNNQAGDLVGPVETDFGYHVILIGKVQAPVVKPFKEVREALVKEWLENKIADDFEKSISDIDQIAFENSDSLDKVASAYDLPVKQMNVLADASKNAEPLAKHPKVHEASFSDDVLYSHKNSEVIRVSPDNAVVLRVVQHQDPAVKPFDTVKDELKKSMLERQGLFLAREKTNTVLEAFNKGETVAALATQQGFTWKTVSGLNRQNAQQLPPTLVEAAFSIPQQGTTPVMTGAELPSRGSALVVVNAIHPGVLDPRMEQAALNGFTQSLQQFKGARDFNSYITDAKEHAHVVIE